MAEPASVAPEKLTFHEFLERYADVRAEYVEGEVLPMSPVRREHDDLQGFLVSLLRHFAEAHDLGEVHGDNYLMRNPDSGYGRVPDLMFVRRENLTKLRDTHLEGPADLVVEIVSPESRERDRGTKFYEYEQMGVEEYWLIDPVRHQVEFYVRDVEGFYQAVPLDREGRYESRAMSGLWLEVGWLFSSPRPRLREVLRAWGLV